MRSSKPPLDQEGIDDVAHFAKNSGAHAAAHKHPHEQAPAAFDLLTRCPAITKMLAARYPMVILDEHQDSSTLQHSVLAAFRQQNGCRVRVFGDPMQAIYESSAAGIVTWDQLLAEASSSSSLTDAQRWRDNRELGDWILAARSELRIGRPLPCMAHHLAS
jgi:hypothetical protein